jgi:hypothetical protein
MGNDRQATVKAKRLAAAFSSAVMASLLVFLAGCGNFWQAPTGSSKNNGTATTTTLSASNSSVSAGAGVTLTATVSPSAATGTVTFFANNSSIGSGSLSSGTASFDATFATAGTETLKATYGGDSTYAGSTSSAISLTVTAAAGSGSVPKLNAVNPARETNLVLDPEATWMPSATVHLHDIADVVVSGSTVQNIEGGGHCVFYSGAIFFSGDAQGSPAESNPSGVYELSGGGVLAPDGTTGIGCE